MARPQQFEQDHVLKAAMLQFWHEGYAASSMSKLLEVTGLTPSSFYNAFGSKKALFLKVIEHYNVRVVGARNRRHLTGDNPIAAIEKFFLSSFEPLRKGEIHGCLLANTSSEFGGADDDIRAAVWAGLQQVELGFREPLSKAKKLGLLRPEFDEAASALHLLGCFQGLMVIGRLTQDKSRLRSLTRSAMASLHD